MLKLDYPLACNEIPRPCENFVFIYLKDDTYSGIIDAYNTLRSVIDDLELIVDDSAWPLPKYREMLFVY